MAIQRDAVDLDDLDFVPILAEAEVLLTEARRLAEWADAGPVDHAWVDMLYRVVHLWLNLESVLTANGMVGNMDFQISAHLYEQNDPRIVAVRCLNALAEDVRQHSGWWRKDLHDKTKYIVAGESFIEPFHLDLAPDACMGMPHSAFCKRLAVVVDELRNIAVAKNSVVAEDESKREGIPRDEARILIRDFLRKNPTSTVRQINKATQVSTGAISKNSAYKAHRAKLSGNERPVRGRKVQQLTHKMLESIGSGFNPADWDGDDLEEAALAFLHTKATPRERAETDGLKPEELRERIELVIEQQLGDSQKVE